MGLIEIVTCDLCNQEGDIDLELIGHLDEGMRFQVTGGEEYAVELGWDISEHSDPVQHICPECQEGDDDDDDEEE